VQLADFVVTYSLQLNNRCLRYLADCDVRGSAVIGVEVDTIQPDVSVYAENLLARDSRRLRSMWDMLARVLEGDADLSDHLQAIEATALYLTGGATHQRLALRLASIAPEEAQAQAMITVVRACAHAAASSELTWDSLNQLFLHDSTCWRNTTSHACMDDALLIKRIVKNYRGGFKSRSIYEETDGDGQAEWLRHNAESWLKYAQHSVHQLELLRPRLSDKGKAQLWYLEKLADTLRTRVGLEKLRIDIKSAAIDKAVRKLAKQLVIQQIYKMDRRLERPSYKAKPKRVKALIGQATNADALEQVALLAVPRPRNAQVIVRQMDRVSVDRSIPEQGLGNQHEEQF